MRVKQPQTSIRSRLRALFGRRARRHDALLVFSLSAFNFTDSWSRTFAEHEYGRSWA
jgi:hypothetical protein